MIKSDNGSNCRNRPKQRSKVDHQIMIDIGHHQTGEDHGNVPERGISGLTVLPTSICLEIKNQNKVSVEQRTAMATIATGLARFLCPLIAVSLNKLH